MTEKKLDSEESIYAYSINNLQGLPIDLNQFKGKKILFVNVASKCGFTSQYKELQELHNQFKSSLVIIGLPCNQFGGQEPGNAKEIESFCQINYGIEFLITEKIDVKGDNQHGIYKWLTQKSLNGKEDSKVKWNFQKYLIDENGKLLDVFSSNVSPSSEKILKYLN